MCRLDWSDDGVHGEVYAGTSGGACLLVQQSSDDDCDGTEGDGDCE